MKEKVDTKLNNKETWVSSVSKAQTALKVIIEAIIKITSFKAILNNLPH